MPRSFADFCTVSPSWLSSAPPAVLALPRRSSLENLGLMSESTLLLTVTRLGRYARAKVPHACLA